MKKLLTVCLVGLTAVSLVACEQPMTKQDVGVLSGAAVGGLLGSQFGQGSGRVAFAALGAVGGAFLGGAIGKSMDDTDRMKMNQTFENNPTGQPAYWTNNHTGTQYEVTPVKNVTVHHNHYCREYRTNAVVAGKTQQVYGTACRQPDGSWKVVK